MQLLYGKPLAEKVERAVARRAAKMRQKPALAVVLVGNDRASLHYVERKRSIAQSLGCRFTIFRIPATASPLRLIVFIKQLNKNKAVHGIIIQLPLPPKYDTEKILASIAPAKDVDNLRGDSPFISPSVQAIWHMLGKTGKCKKNTRILIVGYGRLIGKPLYAFLLKKEFTNVVVADTTTKNLSALCIGADVVISAVGKPGLIRRVKKGAIVIDAGAGFYKGKIKGDVDIVRVAKLAKIVTPVPGGIGPLTVAYLFKNLLSATVVK